MQRLLGGWREVLDQVTKVDMLSRRFFVDTVPLHMDHAHLTVGVNPEFIAEIERMQNPRITIALSKAVSRIFGRQFSISYQPLSPTDKLLLPTDHPVPTANDPNAPELTGMRKWYANPIVKIVVEAFNGEISDVRE